MGGVGAPPTRSIRYLIINKIIGLLKLSKSVARTPLYKSEPGGRKVVEQSVSESYIPTGFRFRN
jgi:hypothetical protein